MIIKRKFLAKVVLSFASFSFHIKENEEGKMNRSYRWFPPAFR